MAKPVAKPRADSASEPSPEEPPRASPRKRQPPAPEQSKRDVGDEDHGRLVDWDADDEPPEPDDPGQGAADGSTNADPGVLGKIGRLFRRK